MNKEYFSQEFENCVNAMDEDEFRAAIFEKARTTDSGKKILCGSTRKTG